MIDIDPLVEEARRLWTLVLELAVAFGSEREWTLIGGLMVQLHAIEHRDDLRPTDDIDVLGDARRRPSMTGQIAEILIARGAEVASPPRSDSGLGYRFEIEGAIVELLGPDGLARDPETVGGLTTFQVPGGTQALRRTETVLVSIDGGQPRPVRRPNLLGAVLIKARAIAKRRKGKFDSDRQDLIRLLSYLEDPRGLATDLAGNERRWLQAVEAPLNFDDPRLPRVIPVDALVRARHALLLLTS